MLRTIIYRAWLLPVLLVAACASSGGEEQDGSPSGKVTFAAGTGTEQDIAVKVNRIVNRHQYQIYRTEPLPNLSFETYWKERFPLPDEEKLGLGSAKTRLLIRTRVRQRTANGDIFAVMITAENLAQQKGGGEWLAVAPTDEFRRYVKKIADELKSDLEAGIRSY